MWILLREGDKARHGDEFWREKTCMWMPIGAWFADGHVIKEEDLPMRRNLTGWEAVKHALEQEVLGTELGCNTTPLFWDCACKTDYIHPSGEWCPECQAIQSEHPDSRKAEVILKIIDET